MSDGKKTAFERAANVPTELVEDGDEDAGEARAMVPRAIFAKDQKPDLAKMTISQLRVAQGMTEEVKSRKADVGQFVLTNYPAYDKVTIVPFGAPDIRQYKPDPKKPAVCHAPNGDFGFGVPGGPCDTCPLSKWTENPNGGNNIPPPCKEGILVRAYSITHKCIVDFLFLAGERSKGGFIQQQSLSWGWANFAIEMSTSSKENQRGSWFVTQLEMLDEVPAEQRDIVNTWYEVFLRSQVESSKQAVLQLQAQTT